MSEPSKAQPAVRTFQILTLAATGMAALLTFISAAGHDQLWFLLMAQRWLAGAPLYGSQAFDSNTPAIVWLSAVPAALGQHLHLAASAVAKLLVVLLEIAIAAIAYRLLPPLTRIQRWFLAFLFITLYAVIPARDFGQRDHLTALLLLPYLLATNLGAPRKGSPAIEPDRSRGGLASETRVSRPATYSGGGLASETWVSRPATNPGAPGLASETWVSRPATYSGGGLASETWVFALLAAAGVCLKPQLALVPLTIELYLFLRTRRLRPEPLLFLAAGAIFLAAIRLFAPLYFTSALPLTRATYWAIGHLTPWQLLQESPQLTLLAIVTIALHLLERTTRVPQVSLLRPGFPRMPDSIHPDELLPATRTLLVAALSATLAYYLQGTGWYYQQLPAIIFFGLALAFQLTQLKLATPRGLPAATTILTVLALILTFHFSGYPPINPDTTYAIESPDPAFFRSLAPGTPVAILTTSVEDAIMPVFRYNLVWAQRTNNLWTLPAILRGTRLTPARQAALAAQQRRWMVEDLTRWHPRLILIARCQSPEVHCQTLEDRHDNLLAFFNQDPAFREILSHYTQTTSRGAYDAYALNPPPPDRSASVPLGVKPPSPPRYNQPMARIYPFRALRYDTSKVNMEDVVTQPYDKITPEMQQAYYDRSKYNLIRVILGKKEPGDTDAFAPAEPGAPQHNIYTRAAESLVSWRKKSILREEAEPALYGYSQTYTVPGTDTLQERRGFIALGHLYDYTDHVVYRHEQTFPKHKSDRLALFKATRAYCEQIYMLYSDPAFTAEELIFGDRTKDTRPADLEITDEYNVIHKVWKLTDPHLINLIVTAMADKKLIIADGHHRYETSVTYMHERAQALGLEPAGPTHNPVIPSQGQGPANNSVILSEGQSPQPKDLETASPASTARAFSNSDPTATDVTQADESPSNRADDPRNLLPKPAFPEAAMMMTFVNMEAPGITILPTHRVVFGLPNFSAETFLTAAEQYFDILPVSTPNPGLLAGSKQVAFIAVIAQGSHLLTARPEIVADTLHRLHPEITARQAALDVVQLHRIVLEHLLHLTHESIANTENIRYLRSAEEAVQQVEQGRADVAFLIRPVTLQQLNDISLSGDVMPQKSTDFYPKLLSGLAIYALD